MRSTINRLLCACVVVPGDFKRFSAFEPVVSTRFYFHIFFVFFFIRFSLLGLGWPESTRRNQMFSP